MTTVAKGLEHYLSLPYTLVLKRDEEGDFVARIHELDGCAAHGATENEALEHLKGMQTLWIQDCLESGQTPPEPAPAEESLPSGKWVQRVPRSLHRRLTQIADREAVSLNQLVTSILSEAIAARASSRTSFAEVLVARPDTVAAFPGRLPGGGLAGPQLPAGT